MFENEILEMDRKSLLTVIKSILLTIGCNMFCGILYLTLQG